MAVSNSSQMIVKYYNNVKIPSTDPLTLPLLKAEVGDSGMFREKQESQNCIPRPGVSRFRQLSNFMGPHFRLRLKGIQIYEEPTHIC